MSSIDEIAFDARRKIADKQVIEAGTAVRKVSPMAALNTAYIIQTESNKRY
jgi:hypothetical protein